MRGAKRLKAIELELEQLEKQLNLKLISESEFTKQHAALSLEMDQILYNDCKRELAEAEDYLKYLHRSNDRLFKDYLVYVAKDKGILPLVDRIIKQNTRAIKRTKKFRTFLLNFMKQLSKTV